MESLQPGQVPAEQGSMDLLFALLPFLLVFGFWVFLRRNVEQGANPMLDKLEEIRAELERLRRSIEQRGF
jgi:hypothetical protein